MRFLVGPRLLVIDEVGYLPIAADAATALFGIRDQRHLKRSVCLRTNSAVDSWGKIFDDPTRVAAVANLLHRNVVFNIDDEPYPVREHRACNEAVSGRRNPRTKGGASA